MWVWLWTALAFYTLLLTAYGFLTFDNKQPEDNRFYYFVIIPGFCLLIIQQLADRFAKFNHLSSLELLPGEILRWSTRRRKMDVPLRDVWKLTLYTTHLSPAWATKPFIRHSGSLHHSKGVIFIDRLTNAEFQQLEWFFAVIVHTDPEIEMGQEITPYDPANEMGWFGG